MGRPSHGPWTTARPLFESRTTCVLPITTVQGKPVVRRGRKARDLPRKTARLPGTDRFVLKNQRWFPVKANLARFTVALSLLATMALSLGAGIKWY
jgi:hypothetical protein